MLTRPTAGARPPVPTCSSLLVALLCCLSLLVLGCGTGSAPMPGAGPTTTAAAAPAGRPLTVVATTNVWGAVVSAVAGPGVTVRSIVSDPAGDPHSYEATPADAAAITGADLVVTNGGGYDPWAEQITAGDPGVAAKTVEAFALRPNPDDDNEHVWFDPTTVTRVIGQIAERLAAAEPTQADALRQRAATFTAQIDQARRAMSAIGPARPSARVAATEPIAHYLLANAGVQDVTPPAFVDAVEQESDPPAAAITAINQLVDTRQIAALVFNPQTETPLTTQLRDQATAAGLPVVEVTETLPPNTYYLTWLNNTRAALARALGAPA